MHPHLGVALHHHVEHADVFIGELILLQEGHALAAVEATLPAEGSSTPARIFMKVDLPAPLARSGRGCRHRT
jgi:hypothetical protein